MNQRQQTWYYDKSARDIPALNDGDTVRMKPFRIDNRSRKKKRVVERLEDRSYEVEDTYGTVYRCNRVHQKKTHEAPLHLGCH